MREMSRQMEVGTRNLTDEQKAQHIENIFGADSSRAANILLKEGAQGYNEMTKAVNKNGAATALAAARNSGFIGSSGWTEVDDRNHRDRRRYEDSACTNFAGRHDQRSDRTELCTTGRDWQSRLVISVASR